MATLRDKITKAQELSGRYLYEANVQSEKGNSAKAEELYAKSQYWMDRMNTLMGND